MRTRTARTGVVLAALVASMAGQAWGQTTPAPFSNPTRIRNQYLPVSLIRQSITLGEADGEPYRVEVTLLPGSHEITWSGGTTRVRTAQFAAYEDDELAEIAYDFFAQDDDGNVWYFGEDVFNYRNGRIVNMEGTWLAGEDGAPPGLIMPANPTPGQVYFPENMPPEIFEEATVVRLNEPTTTPAGTVGNGLLVSELVEGVTEFKVFAPGWGETEVRSEDENLQVVLVNHTGAPQFHPPRNLDQIESLSEEILFDVPDWQDVDRRTARLVAAWSAYRPRAIRAGMPAAFVAAMDPAVDALVEEAAARRPRATREAASDIRKAAMDLMSFYNPPEPVDLERLETVQYDLMLDVGSRDWVSARGELAIAADALWGRVRPWVARGAEGTALATEMDVAFAAQGQAIADHHAQAAAAAFRDILELIELIEDEAF